MTKGWFSHPRLAPSFLFRALALVIFSQFTFVLHGQSLRYEIEHIPVTKENQSFSGTSILQDKEGFMWFGSKDGLYRYDGSRFMHYQPNLVNPDARSLSYDDITCLFEDEDGIIWIGGFNLARFDKKTEVFREFGDTLKGLVPDWKTVQCIVGDKQGNLWLGTLSGLMKFNKRSETYTAVPFVSDYRIFTLMIDHDGILWIQFGEKGLGRYDIENDQFEIIPNTPCVLRILFEDSSQRFWITSYCGIYLFDRATKTFTQYFSDPGDPNRLDNQVVRSILEDHSSNLWIRTFDGIYMFNKDLELKYSWKQALKYTHFALHYNLTLAFYEDQQGIIWFFTETGVNKIIHKYNNFQVTDQLPEQQNYIRQLYEDQQQNLWYRMNNSLCRLNRTTNNIRRYGYHEEDSLLLDDVTSDITLCFDSHENFWMADHHKGLYKLNSSEDKTLNPEPIYEIPEDERSETILSHPFADSKGRIWYSLNFWEQYYYDQVQDKIFRLTEIPGSEVNFPLGAQVCLELDSTTLFAGGWNGMYKIDLPLIETNKGTARPSGIFEIKFRNDTNSISMVTKMIVAKIYQPGTIWANFKGGIIRITEGRTAEENRLRYEVKQFSTRNGLPGNTVSSLQEDNLGNIWIGTQNGLSKLDPITENITNYSIREGLPSNRLYCILKTMQGELFIGTDNGYISFFPDSMRYNQGLPNVVLTDFTINNQPVLSGENSVLKKRITYSDSIELSYEQNNISFEFASLNYVESERNNYKYMLEGQNDDWIFTGNRNHAEFTNLKPGSYNFRAIGSNNDGVWNEEGAKLHITIHPPPWKTWWAYTIYGFIIAAMILLLWRFLLNRAKLRTSIEVQRMEIEKTREVEQMKSHFFTNISHEFRTPLSLLLGPIEDGIRAGKNEDLKHIDFKMMKRNAKRLQRLINQLLDISRIESGKMSIRASEGDIARFARTIASSFLSMAESKKITYTVEISESEIRCFFDPDKVEKILTNLLSNAFKYSQREGTVSISMKHSIKSKISKGEDVIFEVSNTGKGIEANQLSKIFDRFYYSESDDNHDDDSVGIGLSLTKEIVEMLRGTVDVESEPGERTTFTVILPVSGTNFKEDEMEEAQDSIEHKGQVDEYSTYILEEEMEEDAMAMSEEGNRPEILIVEDNRDLRDYIGKQLISEYKLLETGNGKEGLEAAIKSIPDLIISDLMMPVMGGMKMCEKLKNDPRTSHIPIIMLTAKADKTSKISGLHTGADDYIIKPFDSDELRARVKNLIDQRRKLIEKFRKQFISESTDIEISPGDKVLETLLTLIDQHIADPEFDIAQLAEGLHMSRAQLFRKVSAITGYTPKDLIRNIRLKKAASLFRSGHKHVAQVMHQVGFNSQSYFGSCFSKLYGFTPSEYIRNNSSESNSV